jgi:V8-like Glu-specific endopeptidase
LQATAVQRSGAESFVQWKAQGQVLWSDASIVYHDLDTTAGSSGALLIDSATGRGVGIHTHGGCDTMKNNKGTLISEVPNLVRAINSCRNAER